MDLNDAELELIAHTLGITRDARARKARRVPMQMKSAANAELDEAEALLRRVYDEQKERRKTVA